MQQYLDLVEHVLENGVKKSNRTDVDTLSSFAYSYKVDLSNGYPLLTTKKVFFRSVIIELLWYLRGENHVRWLRDEQDVHIWDEWADENGELGPVYGVQWRSWPDYDGGHIDQINNLIKETQNKSANGLESIKQVKIFCKVLFRAK